MTTVRVELKAEDESPLAFDYCKVVDLQEGDVFQFNKSFSTDIEKTSEWTRFRLYLSGMWLMHESKEKGRTFYMKFLNESGKVQSLLFREEWLCAPIVRRLVR